MENLQKLLEPFQHTGNWLLVGSCLLIGLGAGKLVSRLRLPSVVGYLLAGVVLGPSALGMIGAKATHEMGIITDFGLGIVAFMIGSEITWKLVKRMGRQLPVIILAESFLAFGVVALLVIGFGRWALPASIPVVAAALLFGAMAPASAPAGTVAVIQECRAKGPVTSLLLAVVGLDDGLAIVIYAFAASMAKVVVAGGALEVSGILQGPVLEIAGGLVLGAVVGLALMALLRVLPGPAEQLTAALGAILLTTGLSNVLHLSLILSNLAVGMAVANSSVIATRRAYSSLQGITHPVYVLFFLIAGAHLDLGMLKGMTLLAPLYILGRISGLIGGAYAGAAVTGAAPVVRKYLGMGILSQAGVAIGLAFMVTREFTPLGPVGEKLGILLINTIAATTIFFEILGPITTKIALSRAGEVGQARKGQEAAA